MIQPRWARLALAGLAGCAAAFGLAPHGLWPLTLLGLAALGALMPGLTRAQAGWTAWAFAAGYFAYGFRWLVEPFLVDAATHGWMIPFALSGMAGGLAMFWGLAGWLGAGRGWLTALLIALAELARGYVLTGLPWGGLAQIWVDTSLAQSLALIGPYGLGALTGLAVLPLGAALRLRAGRRMAALPGLALAALALIPAPTTVLTDHMIRIVQPNAAQHLKWHPDWIRVFFERHLELSTQGPPPDLVVWSETAIPGLLGWSEMPFAQIADIVGAPVLAGLQRTEARAYFNSAVLIGAEGEVAALYDKHHLVPFGEYMPLAPLVSQLGIGALAARAGAGYTPGPGPALIDLPGLGPALPLICYEAVFPQDLRGTDRPALLVALTNDAWFGTQAGPYQHLAQARMRAIEQGLPMIRAANTGISAMIDPAGRLLDHLPLGVAGALDAPLPAALAPTLYARFGDWPALALLLVVLGALATRPKRN